MEVDDTTVEEVTSSDEESYPDEWPTDPLDPEGLNVIKASDFEENRKKFYQSEYTESLSQQGQSMTYPMRKIKRTRVHLINNESFKMLREREEAQQEERALDQLFTQFSCDVVIKRNSKCDDMWKEMQRMAREDFEGYDCFILIILSHGLNGAIFGTDGYFTDNKDGNGKVAPRTPKNCLNVQNIVDLFSNVKTLHDKPKLFFIQAAPDSDEAETDPQLRDQLRFLNANESHHKAEQMHPQEDVFIAMSFIREFESQRKRNGSWFVQAIVDVFAKYAYKKDINEMMRMVNGLTGIAAKGKEDCQYILETIHTFQKRFFFFPGFDEGMLYKEEEELKDKQETHESFDVNSASTKPKSETVPNPGVMFQKKATEGMLYKEEEEVKDKQEAPKSFDVKSASTKPKSDTVPNPGVTLQKKATEVMMLKELEVLKYMKEALQWHEAKSAQFTQEIEMVYKEQEELKYIKEALERREAESAQFTQKIVMMLKELEVLKYMKEALEWREAKSAQFTQEIEMMCQELEELKYGKEALEWREAESAQLIKKFGMLYKEEEELKDKQEAHESFDVKSASTKPKSDTAPNPGVALQKKATEEMLYKEQEELKNKQEALERREAESAQLTQKIGMLYKEEEELKDKQEAPKSFDVNSASTKPCMEAKNQPAA